MKTIVEAAAVAWPYVISLLLIASGVLKLIDKEGGAGTALSALVGSNQGPLLWIGLSSLEVAVGVLGIIAIQPIALVLQAALMAGAGLYALAILPLGQDKPCGCFGKLSRRIKSKAQIRARVALTWAIAVISGLDAWWWSSHPDVEAAALACALAGLVITVALAALFDETRELVVTQVARGIPALAQKGGRVAQGQKCQRHRSDQERMIRKMTGGDLWSRYSKILVKTGVEGEYWREDCWEFYALPGCYRDLEGTAVFARCNRVGAHEDRVALVLESGETPIRFREKRK